MYDELIKRLRETSIDFGESDHISVMMIEAANAIEELSHPQIAPEKIIHTMWIPVTERLPREQETVLIWGKQGVILLDWRHDNKWSCFRDVTHWMPLPQPPESEGG